MKTIFLSIFAILICIFFAERANAGNFYRLIEQNYSAGQDTSKYIKTIIANKRMYQGKNLNTLLEGIKISVNSYIYVPAKKPGGSINKIILYFEKSNTMSDKRRIRLKQTYLVVTFEQEIPNPGGLYVQSEGKWIDVVKKAYETLIVKDIEVYDLNEN